MGRKAIIGLAALLASLALVSCSYFGEGRISAPGANFIAVSRDSATQQTLLRWCVSESAEVPPEISRALHQHSLAQVPSGTKIIVRKDVGGDFHQAKNGKIFGVHLDELAEVKIAEGPLRGQVAYMCPGTFYLFHAMP